MTSPPLPPDTRALARFAIAEGQAAITAATVNLLHGFRAIDDARRSFPNSNHATRALIGPSDPSSRATDGDLTSSRGAVPSLGVGACADTEGSLSRKDASQDLHLLTSGPSDNSAASSLRHASIIT